MGTHCGIIHDSKQHHGPNDASRSEILRMFCKRRINRLHVQFCAFCFSIHTCNIVHVCVLVSVFLGSVSMITSSFAVSFTTCSAVAVGRLQLPWHVRRRRGEEKMVWSKRTSFWSRRNQSHHVIKCWSVDGPAQHDLMAFGIITWHVRGIMERRRHDDLRTTHNEGHDHDDLHHLEHHRDKYFRGKIFYITLSHSAVFSPVGK